MRQTFSGTATAANKLTLSFWIKRSSFQLGTNTQAILNTETGNLEEMIRFDEYDRLHIFTQNSAGAGTSSVKPSYQFKDPSAWYHIVVGIDTTQSTDTDRFKFWVNGSRLTVFTTTSYISQNYTLRLNTAVEHEFGVRKGGAFLDAYIAELVYIDGQQLDADQFGEYDDDSPRIWKPIDISGLTFGNNGFYCDFADSGDLGDDESGNGNDFTEAGLAATDQATDTPTNNFATLNPLASLPNTSKSTFSEGNCVAVGGSNASYVNGGSTIGVANGKWYVETKLTASSDGDARCITGVTMDVSEISRINQDAGANNIAYAWHYGNIAVAGSTSGYTSLTTSAVNDIVGVALDMDNGKVYFSKNGSWINSGDPTSGATGTGAAPVAASTTGLRFFFSGSDSNARTMTTAYNFGGCPAFAISSGNADANGYGNFEYPPPSGYYSLCTKNLAEFGG